MADPYISEVDYRGGASTDSVEVVVDAGTDVSNIQVASYHPSGGLRWTSNLGALQDTIAGKDVYVISGKGVHMNGALSLVVDGSVTQFISFDQVVTANGGAADGLSSTQIGSVGSDQAASLVSADGGASYTFQAVSDPGVIPCFLSGTDVLTPDGPRRVERLQVGDLVETPQGPMPVRWIGRTLVKAHDDDAFPVRIPAGCFGGGLPQRDLLLSPNHRIALQGYDCELLFGTDEVLVAAKHLIGRFGIAPDPSYTRPVYYHLLCDAHELLWSNGLLTESFHPGEVMAQNATDTMAELFTLFPELARRYQRDTHSICLRAHEAQVLADLRLAG